MSKFVEILNCERTLSHKDESLMNLNSFIDFQLALLNYVKRLNCFKPLMRALFWAKINSTSHTYLSIFFNNFHFYYMRDEIENCI